MDRSTLRPSPPADGSTAATANASANGIAARSFAAIGASASITNNGAVTVLADASAVASGCRTRERDRDRRAPVRFGLHGASAVLWQVTGTLSVSAIADAGATFGAATANANATGLQQLVTAFDGTASVANNGGITVVADASASTAFFGGIANALAVGVSQDVTAAIGAASYAGTGSIDVSALAFAADSQAAAGAFANGLLQQVNASSASASVTNDGAIFRLLSDASAAGTFATAGAGAFAGWGVAAGLGRQRQRDLLGQRLDRRRGRGRRGQRVF